MSIAGNKVDNYNRRKAEQDKFLNATALMAAREHAETKLLNEYEKAMEIVGPLSPEYNNFRQKIDLFHNDRAKWRRENANELGRYSPAALSHQIAPFMSYRMADLANPQGANIIVPMKAIYSNSQFPEIDDRMVALYSGLNVKKFNKAFTFGKSQETTGIPFLYQAVSNFTKGTPYQAIEAIKNIKKHAGRAVVWDLETFGRLGAGGYDSIQRITEFSFSDGVGDFKKGTFNINKTYGSIIGISEKEHADMMSLIDRFSKNKELTEGELVTLDRLALHGSSKTVVNWNDAKNGVVRFSSFAEQKDLAGIHGTLEDMRKGADLLLKIGKYQNETRVGNDMFGWEKELLAGLRSIVDNDLTAIGHNVNRFDISQLDYLLHNEDMTSKAFRNEVKALFKGEHLRFNHTLDSIVPLRENMGDPYTFWRNYLGNDDKKMDEFSRWMKAQEETPKTQQTLLAAMAINSGVNPAAIHYGQAHIAEADAADIGRVVFGSGFYDPDSPTSLIHDGVTKKALTLKANNTQLFYAKNSSWNPQTRGIVTFTYDKATEQWGSSDGIVTTKNGRTRALYQIPGVRRRALYTLSGIDKVTEDSPLWDMLASHPNLAGGDLFAFRWTPHSNSKMSAAQRDVVWVGTHKDIMDAINNMMLLAGVKQKNDGKEFNIKDFSMDSLSPENLEALKTVMLDANGNYTRQNANLNTLMDISTRAFNDAAGRIARDKNLSRDMHLLSYIDAMDTYVAKHSSGKTDMATIEGLRQQFRNQVKAKTDAVYKEHVLTGKSYDNLDYAGTFVDYFGYIDKNTNERKAYADAMENAAALEQWGRANYKLINASYTAVKDKFGDNVKYSDPGAKFFYKQVREMLEDAAVAKVGKSGAGYNALPRVMGELNKFQVDIEGFYGLKTRVGSKIASFSMDSDYGLADSLLRQMGKSAEDIASTQEDEKITLLKNFQKMMLNKGIIKLEDVGSKDYLINADTDNLAFAGGKISLMMRLRRQKDAMAGILSTTEQFDIIDNLANAGLTDDEIMGIKEQAQKFSFEIAPSFKPIDDGHGNLVWDRNSKEWKDFQSSISRIAKDVNDNIVFNNGFNVSSGDKEEEAAFVQKLVDTAGYSPEDARKVYKMQRARYSASQSMLESVIGGIYTHGGAIGYNPESGQFWVYNTAEDVASNNYTLVGLDKNVWNNGSFHRRLANGQEFADEVGLYYSEKLGGLMYSTEEGRLAKDSEGLFNWYLNNGRNSKNMAEAVTKILGVTRERYRQHSADYYGDLADWTLSNVLNINDYLLSDLGESHREKLIGELRKEHNQAADIMAEFFSKPQKEKSVRLKEASRELAAAALQTMHITAPYVLNNIKEGQAEFKSLIGDNLDTILQITKSHGGDTRGQVPILSGVQRGLMAYDKDSRHIGDKMNRALPFNLDRAKRIMAGRGARFGSAFQSMQEHMHMNAISEGLGYDLADTMVVNRLSASSEDMRKLMAYAGKHLGENSYEYQQMMLIFTDEGSAAMSAFAADAGLENEHYEQHVAFGRIARSDIENNKNFEKLINASSTITFDKNGKAHFKSSEGVYVQADEELFLKASNSATYKDEIVRAKQEGLLKSGIYKNGQRMTDEAVSDYINAHIDQTLTGDAREEAAWALFTKENSPFVHSFYVESLDIAGHTKTLSNNEKNMNHVLMNGVGKGSTEVDRKIAATMKELGAEGLIGRQIHFSIIEEMMNKSSVSGTSFAAYVRGMAMTKAINEKNEAKRERLMAMSNERINEIITKNFGGVASFAAALEEERYRTSRTMDAGLKAIGIKDIVDEFDMSKAGEWKHGGPGPFMATFNALIDYKGLSHEEAKAVMEKYGAMNGIVIHTDKDGSKWAKFKGDTKGLNIRGLDKVNEAYFAGKNGWHSSIHELETDHGKVMYEIGRAEKKAIPNYNVGKSGSSSTFKADERTLDSLKMSVYTQKYLDKAGTEIDRAFGDTAFSRAVKDFTNSKKDGDLANQTLMNDFMKKAFVHDGDPKKVQGAYYMLKNGAEADGAKAGMAWLKEQGVNEQTAQRAIKSLQRGGIENATANKILTLVEANSAANAHEYNRTHRYTDEEMKKLGFNVMSIDELRTNAHLHVGGEGEFAKSLYGQAIVLDLHSKALGNDQLYGKDIDRKIAIPFSALQAEDETGAQRKSDIQRMVSSFAKKLHDYSANYQSNVNNGDANAKARDALVSDLTKIKDKIAETTTNKNGAIKSASTTVIGDGTMYGTAQGFKFLGGGLDGALGKAHFLDSGKSFTELADTRNAVRAAGEGLGMDMGFLFASTYHRNVIYSDKMFEKIAGGNAELAQQLKEKTFGVLNKEGTIGVDQRYPLVSRDAVQPVNVHFSDLLGRDEFRVNLETWRQQNGDFDSDKLNAMIRKSSAEITLADGTKTRMDVDFATYRAIDSMNGMSIELLDDNFAEAKAAMVRNAVDVTPYGQPQVSFWGKDKGIADDIYGTTGLTEHTYDGQHLVTFEKRYTNEERQANEQALEELEGKFKSRNAEAFKEMQGNESLYVENMGSFVLQNFSEDEAKRYDEALHYRKWDMGMKELANEASAKKAAGIMNKSLFELSRVANTQMNLTGEQTTELLLSVMALQEGTLSAKNDHGEQDLQRATELQKRWNNAMRAMATGEGREEAATALEEFALPIFNERKKKEFGPRSAMLGETEEITQKSARLLGDMVRTVNIDQGMQKSLKIAVSASGLSASDALNYSSKAATESSNNQAMQLVNFMNEEAGVAGSIGDLDDNASSKLYERAKRSREKMAESMISAGNQRWRRAAAEGQAKMAKRMTDIAPMGHGASGKILAASIGIAAGLMTAGYASGPSVEHDVPVPAQTQAMQMSNDYGDQVSMQQTSLSDSNLNTMRGGPSNGYVININAQTSQGQQAAVNAITNAASGMTPQTGSVNVNLSTSIGNSLSQLQVNRMVANAVGIA